MCAQTAKITGSQIGLLPYSQDYLGVQSAGGYGDGAYNLPVNHVRADVSTWIPTNAIVAIYAVDAVRLV